MRKVFALVCALAAFLAGCSDDRHAGGTEAESTIAMNVVTPDGNPAAFAHVRILPAAYMADGLDSAEWNVADEKGEVQLDVKDSGDYVIEARLVTDSVALGLVTDVTVEGSEFVQLSTDTLGALSTIRGTVPVGEGPSVIRIPGLERYIVPDSAGNFTVDSLPPGEFKVIVESRSNRGTVSVTASSGDSLKSITLGAARGFAVENFESFTGQSATGAILGDGWWYTLDASGKNIMPLWDESLTRAYSGSAGCASGGCARTTERLGFLLGLWMTDYELPGLDTVYFSARGSGKLRIALARGEFGTNEAGLETTISLEKHWKGYAIPLSQMTAYGSDSSTGTVVNRIDFSVATGDTVFLDDVFLGGLDSTALDSVKVSSDSVTSVYPDGNWAEHDSLLASVVGYATGVKGGAGGNVCIVTTTADLDTAKAAVVGSLRYCAYKDSAEWILFAQSGTYDLAAPLRIRSYKTIDGRGRDVRITGMGILTDSSSHLVFENLTFEKPAITALDSTSRRALSIHNLSSYVWVDHCTFRDYPLVEMDIKRGSHSVTVSWSRFESGQTALLFGLQPDMYVESAQTFTLHHNYFASLEYSAVLARFGRLHAYDNFFLDVAASGIACTDSARCYIESNIFNITTPVSLYRLYDSTGTPVDTTEGFVKMQNDWFAVGGEELVGDARGFAPDYTYALDSANADLAWKIKERSGPH